MSCGALLAISIFITFLSQKSSSGDSREKKHRFQWPSGQTEDDSTPRPGFRRAPQNVTVNPGEKAVLRCRVENLGAKTVTWRRFGDVHPLTIGQSTFVADSRVLVDFIQRLGEWNLVIKDIRPLDDGIYQCQINTKDDHHNYHTVYLQVKAVQVKGTKLVVKGDPIQLVCNASGRPDPPRNVEWYRDGRLVESDANGGLIITKKVETGMLVSVLAVRRSRLADAGQYICRSSANDVGEMEVTVLNENVRKRGTSLAEKITSNNAASSSTTTQGVQSSVVARLPCLLSVASLLLLLLGCDRRRYMVYSLIGLVLCWNCAILIDASKSVLNFTLDLVENIDQDNLHYND